MIDKITKKTRGITFIALVITIVVLIILATISVSVVFGENGIIQRTQTGKELHEKEGAREEVILGIGDIQLSKKLENSQMQMDDLQDLTEPPQKGIGAEYVEIYETTPKTATVIHKGYEFEIDDKYNVTGGTKIKGVAPKASHTLSSSDPDQESVAITVTGTTEDAEGIDKIIKPDKTEVSGNTATYEVTGNGVYYFTIIGKNERKKKYPVTITNIVGYNLNFYTGTDNMTVSNTYAKTIQTKTEEITSKIEELNGSVEGTTFVQGMKTSDGCYTMIGQIEGQKEAGYYGYKKYNSKETKNYTSKASGSSTKIQFRTGAYVYTKMTYNKSGNGTYTLSEPISVTLEFANISPDVCYSGKAGVYDSKPSKSITQSYYYRIPTNFTKGDIYTYYNTSYQKYIPSVSITYSNSGTYLDTIASNNTELTTSTTTGARYIGDGYWYIRQGTGEIDKHKLYKYNQAGQLRSIYDPGTKTIQTTAIKLKDPNDAKIQVTATGTDYKLYVSNNQTDWTQIDNSKLDGNTVIDNLPDTIYVKIECNNSTVTNLKVK